MATNPRARQMNPGAKAGGKVKATGDAIPNNGSREDIYNALQAQYHTEGGGVGDADRQLVIGSGAQDALFGVEQGGGATQDTETTGTGDIDRPWKTHTPGAETEGQKTKPKPDFSQTPATQGTGSEEGGSSTSGGSTTTTTTSTESKIEPPEGFEPGELDTSVYDSLYGSLGDLQQIYDESMQPYTPKTLEEMQQQAEQEYDSYYTQLRLAAQQSQEAQDLALQQQREGLQSSYDKAREASEKQYNQAYSQADRQMLSRGMQRSSYTGQTLANISMQGAEAQQALWDEQVAAETQIDQQRTQLAQQLAAQLASYDAQQASDILARLQALEDTEYDRSVQAGQVRASLATQMFQFLYQMGRDDITDQEFMLQYLFGAHQQDVSEYQWYTELMETIRQFNLQHKSEMDRTSAYQSRADKIDTSLRSSPATGGDSTTQQGGSTRPTGTGQEDFEETLRRRGFNI